MDEKRYELVEIQVDAELLEQLEKIIAPTERKQRPL